MCDRLDRVPRLPPGLYFGRAGAAWALRAAAEVRQDAELAGRAEEFGLRLPIRWPNPDICHGVAGAGLAQLRLWQLSGRTEFAERARQCADDLADAACQTEDGVFWPVPGDLDSVLAGAWHFGFAHGVAGVGAFLLAAAQACGEARYLELANAAGRTLAAAQQGEGAHYRDLVHAAALAVRRARWMPSPVACHGLAASGQFLLDAAADAQRLGSPRAADYRRWAEDLAAVIVVRAAWSGGRLLVPDETGMRISAGYGTGMAGVLDFLLRLDQGGERSWMVEAG